MVEFGWEVRGEVGSWSWLIGVRHGELLLLILFQGYA